MGNHFIKSKKTNNWIVNPEKSKHTPGPWQKIQSVKDRKTFIIQAHKSQGAFGSYQIAKVKSALNADFPMTKENAKLIAAAPDLLEACQAAKHRHWLKRKSFTENDHDLMNMLSDAIKKAT
ncbi:MAG: hypothetical protein BBJ57_02315 [Desulfobacterales bacterium PC51MH44]|nr:MAG: hypothetical protein BBJ57_02315 [Desulfobacterales bacterium PC51MH44]